ncbi:HopJ type III effector protein [Alcanivorax quisquiliarum]|uniref:HopJ type III effector protein n=1 Tax=Alcanivorax quisquiliarum TaxID=2933565 RepID=A0ABT0E4Z9_9GAMM|nr:HopJ type III effector protein [Alcanivorax quisquiliarum]MCK0536896.1 HopJ type III effector protein [Alcanivorax quisquiliarum]
MTTTTVTDARHLTEETLLQMLESHPAEIEFEQVMAVIDAHYDYTPTRFTNGIKGDQVINNPGENEGACRIFAFAKLHDLNTARTLACFGRFYRNDVLDQLNGRNHPNIRVFMRHGWSGIQFDGEALAPRTPE